ncbi:MAG: hypothetical protein EOP22_08880 [Hyphomicrobiales bacterium]|nr:MAG: hypothetical protein EOP22_08880 [Hyphomicrobiales bacterium]
MYFCHEFYRDACSAGALEDLGAREPRDDDRHCAPAPIPFPAMLIWLLVVSVALCALTIAIQLLSSGAAT